MGLLVLQNMDDESKSAQTSFLKGRASLIIAVVVVSGLFVFLPAYRWFFLISVGIAIVFVVAIYFWHKLNPITESDKDIDNKHPLGLS